MNFPKRIHIIGSTGSGKTYLAERLSKKYKLIYGELDTVMWSGTEEFSCKNSSETRDRLLHNIIEQDKWVVEGVYYKWLTPSFHRAELIIYLDTKLCIRAVRIILRYIKQRLGLERSIYNQTLKGLIKMLEWNQKFERDNKYKILEFIEPYKSKVIIIKNSKEIEELL
ncbi:DNA topology modulation protein FlaR [Paenibacillus sp. J5C_2022]|uniref:AAA family ATPase n=1 Tax=Paenibacillus sp. J5C2022 TaxID=2977129 RepID=UPI0021D0DA56|nr:DNA topology modulation protein FlaR [Paenibacillus sp. J5C2022]MCU6713190.1 DNA topology modulation protein FlaR [Paenibacillus sp. J5C2022]